MTTKLAAASPITSSVISTGALDPAADAIGANTEQARLAHNPDTPEPDSITETLALCESALAMALKMVHETREIALRLAASNRVELAAEQQIAGWADTLSRELRDLELNATSDTLTGRRVAEMLRPLLAELSDPLSMRHTEARRELHEAFTIVPRCLLLRDAAAYHLNKTHLDTLTREHMMWKRGRPRQSRAWSDKGGK
jgi:hypothetical protein